MNRKQGVATAAAAGALAIGGFLLAGSDVGPLSATATTTAFTESVPPNCEDWGVTLPSSSCFAAGVIRNVSLSNLQGAAQFCKWKAANPGEWTRLKGYAGTQQPPTGIVTWFGAHVLNDLQAYFAAGGPPFTIKANTAPNVCSTPLAPPVVVGVTPGQTDVTVTVTTSP